MAATTETFTLAAIISPFERRPDRDPVPEPDPKPIGRCFIQGRETSTLVGATDSVLFTFQTTMPQNAIYKLKFLAVSAAAATQAPATVTLGRYVQDMATFPDQDASPPAISWSLVSAPAVTSPAAATRFWRLGVLTDNSSGPFLDVPPYFKVSAPVGSGPSLFFYDDDGGVAVLSWNVDMIF